MKKWTLACAVLTVAGLAASEASAQETLKVQPTPVIQSEVGPRNGPVRRILGRRDREIIPASATVTRTETTTKVEQTPQTTTKVEQVPPITTQSQPQVVESRRDGRMYRLRGRLGRI